MEAKTRSKEFFRRKFSVYFSGAARVRNLTVRASLSGEMVGGGGSEKSKDGITCCHAGARPIGWASYPSKHYGVRDEKKVKHEYFLICNPDN